jgi:ABC-type transport system substrate-binding protein
MLRRTRNRGAHHVQLHQRDRPTEKPARSSIRSTAGIILAGLLATAPVNSQAETGVTGAMTAGDIPLTTGDPDQGFEGFRLVGYNLYDSRALWDLSERHKPSNIGPGLATAWQVDPNNHRRWIIQPRQGEEWHDGCPFADDDVPWNFARVTDKDAPRYVTRRMPLSRTYVADVEAIEKIDGNTVGVTTKVVNSLFPYSMPCPLMVSRCRAEASKHDWAAYARNGRAVMTWVAHDPNPRASSPKLTGFARARNGFQDLTPIVANP